MLTHLENEAAQIEAALRSSLATETAAASPVASSPTAESPTADTPKTIIADSPPASAASVRTLEQLHEARAQIALLEQRNRHLESVVDGLLKPYGKLKGVVEWWSTMEL